jgi:hypothetical protein
MIKAEILLQGGHTVVVETRAATVDDAAGKFKSELTGGWQIFASKYLIHPGSVAAVRFYDTDEAEAKYAAPREKTTA